jgi:hypothetical protein
VAVEPGRVDKVKLLLKKGASIDGAGHKDESDATWGLFTKAK